MTDKQQAINEKIVNIDTNVMDKFIEVYPDSSALFNLLGTTCNRDCSTCVLSTNENVADEDPVTEADIIANSAQTLKLDYVIIRSKPILLQPDNGAFSLRNSIKEVKKYNSDTIIEAILPDFKGEEALISIIVEEDPNIITYYIEDINEDLDIEDKLNALYFIKDNNPNIITKTGFKMDKDIDRERIKNILDKLKNINVDIIAIEDISKSPDECTLSDYYGEIKNSSNTKIYCSKDAMNFKNSKKIYNKFLDN